jgi:hypothetical protein
MIECLCVYNPVLRKYSRFCFINTRAKKLVSLGAYDKDTFDSLEQFIGEMKASGKEEKELIPFLKAYNKVFEVKRD